MHNSKNKKYNIDYKVEYNPNKIMHYEKIKSMLKISHTIELKYIDIAVDLDVPISNILILNNNRDMNIYKGTYYIGERSNGIKIYDKAKEQKIKDRDWTRIEYRIKIENMIKPETVINLYNAQFPEIKIIDNKLYDDVESILLIEGLNNRPELYKKLTRYKKDKMKKITESLYTISFQNMKNDIEKMIKEYITNII
jgi:hypothetical protein